MSRSLSILLTGASGYVGTYLLAHLGARRAGTVHVLTGDVTDPDLEVPPTDVVIHLAGKLNSFRGDPAEVERINLCGTRNLARRCQPHTQFIFLSSDQVFGSDPARQYVDSDPVAPETAYGQTKARAETFLRGALPRVTILRTSILYGYQHPRRQSTVAFIESRLRAGQPVDLYRDVFGCPTYVGDLAACILMAIQERLTGVYHACGGEYLSRCAIGQAICHVRGYDPALIRPVDRPDAGGATIPRAIHLRQSEILQGLLSTRLLQGLAATTSDDVAEGLGAEGVGQQVK